MRIIKALALDLFRKDPALDEMSRRATTAFFETILTLFKKSKMKAQQKAEYYSYLLTAAWRLYAGFIWVDSKSLPAGVDLPFLKAELKGLIMRSIFEDLESILTDLETDTPLEKGVSVRELKT